MSYKPLDDINFVI